MPDGVDPGWVGKDAGLPVALHCAHVPAPLPEFVQHLEIILGRIEAAIVLRKLLQAHAVRRTIELSGDDVPAFTPLGEVIGEWRGNARAGRALHSWY